MRFIGWHVGHRSCEPCRLAGNLRAGHVGGWQRVTFVGPATTVRRWRAELEQAGPPLATRARRAKKASA
jgi:hypothetical protein